MVKNVFVSFMLLFSFFFFFSYCPGISHKNRRHFEMESFLGLSR